MSFWEFAVYRVDSMCGGCRLQGPAIVERPQTTLVVPAVFTVRSSILTTQREDSSLNRASELRMELSATTAL